MHVDQLSDDAARKVKESWEALDREGRAQQQVADVFTTSIAKLSPEPGDIIVFKIPGRLSSHQYERLKHDLAKVMDGTALTGVKAMLLEDGMDVMLISAEKLREAGWAPTDRPRPDCWRDG